MTILLGPALFTGGCEKDLSMTQGEIEKAKKGSPPMTAAQRAAVGALMAKGAQSARDQEQEWASAHADLLPEVNKARVKRGLSPLKP